MEVSQENITILRQIIKKNYGSAKRIARNAFISPALLSLIIHGKKKVTHRSLRAIIVALRILSEDKVAKNAKEST